MKKRISAFILATIMIFLLVANSLGNVIVSNAKEGEGAVVRVHYHREDANYKDWSVWLWPEGGEGGDYAFDNEDAYGVYANFELPVGVTNVGFIVRTPEWGKDIDADQFFDISEIVGGSVDIYIESGVEGYTKVLGDDAVIGIRLKKAVYNNDSTVTVTMTGEIEGEIQDVFVVTGKDGEIEVLSIEKAGDTSYLVTLNQELILSKSYQLSFEGNKIQINMPNIYSTEAFENEFTYLGNDLGATWTKDKTSFRVWAPTAEKMVVKLYESGTSTASDMIEAIEMTKDVNGTWVAQKSGDLNGVYYTYSVTIDEKTSTTCDPYARTTGYNGARAMVIDLSATNPEGWDEDKNPHAGENITDAIIYEGHIRDLTVDSDSGITNKGRYLGLTETGTKTSTGIATGIDHLKELGITHLQILPFYDFGSVNEISATGLVGYNWGYDPVNYNVPEGSYATDAKNGEVRVKEVKEMIKTLHDNDISVIMDVVYNHVQNAGDFSINVLVPGYFSRINLDGSYSSGSGCGNDTASERAMVRKYIVDSVNYWADEYHIDGFRFDLVGLIDVDTVNEIISSVHEKHPDVIFYGEGWTLNTSVTKFGTKLATQPNSELTPGFAYFNDNIRDGLKGSVFDTATGFVSGANGKTDLISDCFIGKASWCKSPSQSINYASCHDNNTLFDRLRLSRPDADDAAIIKMNNLTAAIYMTAQGVPFMQAGEDFLRTKTNSDGSFNSNSYNAGDDVNTIDYNSLENEAYNNVFDYYKGLIAFRKAHPVLRLTNAEDVLKYFQKVEGLEDNMFAYVIDCKLEGESADEMLLVFNANEAEKTISLPEGKWNVYVNGEKAGTTILDTVSGDVKVPGISSLMLVKEATASLEEGSSNSSARIAGIVAIGLLIGGSAAIIFKRKKK